MVFNATINNISAILWWSVLLVDETGVPGENHRPATSQWRTWSHNVVFNTHRPVGFELITLVVIGTDCTGSCKSNYHTIKESNKGIETTLYNIYYYYYYYHKFSQTDLYREITRVLKYDIGTKLWSWVYRWNT